jgi:hypothetical protein
MRGIWGGGMYGWGMREGAFWTSTMGCVIGLCGARFKSERLSAGQWTGSAMRADSPSVRGSGMTPG